MIILNPSEKPDDNEHVYYMTTNDGKVAWMTFEERFYNEKGISEMKDSVLKEKILAQIPVWQKSADRYKNDPNWWPVKHACVEFWTCDEGKFVIGPGIIENDWCEYLFERVEREIESFLASCGVPITNYTGMMD